MTDAPGKGENHLIEIQQIVQKNLEQWKNADFTPADLLRIQTELNEEFKRRELEKSILMQLSDLASEGVGFTDEGSWVSEKFRKIRSLANSLVDRSVEI